MDGVLYTYGHNPPEDGMMRPRQWHTHRGLWAICTLTVCAVASQMPVASHKGDEFVLWKQMAGLLWIAVGDRWIGFGQRAVYLAWFLGVLLACVISGWALHAVVLVAVGRLREHFLPPADGMPPPRSTPADQHNENSRRDAD